ncbi:methyltransferase [Actinomycetospora sp. CA-084318]|uniref:methyltransferase n=1 Tax=Actinomycetospora sp. CA-084318 TaxID=3239892 RepID=UPI003D99368A
MTAPFTVELDPTPGRRQGEEQFLLHSEGGTQRVTLHDYATVYDVPGLYEEVVQRQLECASPATVADATVEAGAALDLAPADLRAFDLGAGNGVVGEELTARGVTVVVGADGIPEARDAAHRDRPGLYAHYLVGERLESAEVARLVGEERLNALVAAGAVGEGHVPVDALDELWSAFPAGSVLALTLKDAPDDHDVSDVEAMIAARSDTEIVVRRSFRHRLSMAGHELYYLVLAAVKR